MEAEAAELFQVQIVFFYGPLSHASSSSSARIRMTYLLARLTQDSAEDCKTSKRKLLFQGCLAGR